MKFLTWTLHAPLSATFAQWKDILPGEPWHSKNYVTVDQNALKNWDYRKSSFVNQFLINHNKIYAVGMHELTVDDFGNVQNLRNNLKVLNSDETDLDNPVPKSLRYLMITYPNIKWSMQILCTRSQVDLYLDNENLQTEMIRQYKKILQIYISKGFPIKGAEIDFEKTTTREGDWTKYANFLSRVKNEVCIPLGLELRVNLFAMTGDFIPSYYAWHDYKTIASAKDMNGIQAVDEFQLMTYDFSWGGSAPGPSTPIWWLEQVLKHVKESLPPEKTFIGNAGYGRRWPLFNQKYGTTLDYKQLMLLQNGLFVHNNGTYSEDGNFYFADQDYIPFCGFNDIESDYQISFPHVYDRFKARHGIIDTYNGSTTMNKGIDYEYVTNYGKDQHALFSEIKTVLNNGVLSGNYSPTGYTSTITEDVPQPYSFTFYQLNKKRWVYNNNTDSCEIEPGQNGIDGEYNFNFDMDPGSYRLIAYVGFPFFDNDNFNIEVNGMPYTIGSIPEWYPHITNPSTHFFDCGQWDFLSSNTIKVKQTNGAWIGGFIICESYNPRFRGGSVTFPSNLQVMKKRGIKDESGKSSLINAQYPSNMTITGEILRRPPRPAIIWEDYFGPHLNGNGFTESTDLTNFAYYQKARDVYYQAGAGPIKITNGETTYCTLGYSSVGFSQGLWTVHPETDDDYAHAKCNTTIGNVSSAQLILNKKFSTNISCEAEIRITKDTRCRVGLRLLAQRLGEVGDSYLFLLDWTDETVKLVHEVQGNSTVLNSEPMSEVLKSSKLDRTTFKAYIINNKLTCYIGNKVYLDKFNLPYPASSGAFGVYMTYTEIKVYRLTIASLDRYEPMEKISLSMDNQIYEYGEVPRNVSYDEFGYLIYTGYPGNQTEAVRSIPSDPDTIDPATVEGRAGTIFETEIIPESWSLDYKNMQIATLTSWIGKKDIKVIMNDPGIWLRTLYVGDQQGYSISYNSDRIGFIKTADMITDYKCVGIAMWTLGQEDPMVFDYIEKIEN